MHYRSASHEYYVEIPASASMGRTQNILTPGKFIGRLNPPIPVLTHSY